jgi:UDPglucose--hexose-1-phosphate uridylyltransferase
MTRGEIVAYRPNGSGPNQGGWQVRVIPEADPYFAIEEELIREGVGMFDRISPRGASELVIEHPDHAATWPRMDESQIVRVLWMYRDRIHDLKRDAAIRSIVVTRRHRKSGARIRHPHSRILAMPIIFDDLRAELTEARDYYAYKRRCVYCDMVREAVAHQTLLVRATASFVAFVPYAARVPFELRILPRRHGCAYEEITAEEIADLGDMLKAVMDVADRTMGDPPYEMVLHTAPNLQTRLLWGEWETLARDYHWHVELVFHADRQSRVAGIAVNEILPEEAARRLREAEPRGPQAAPP